MLNAYIVNSNLCGYLPSSDGIECETAEEAIDALISLVEDAAESAYNAEIGDESVAKFDEALTELRALRPHTVRNGYAIIIGDECFFIASPFYLPAARRA